MHHGLLLFAICHSREVYVNDKKNYPYILADVKCVCQQWAKLTSLLLNTKMFNTHLQNLCPPPQFVYVTLTIVQKRRHRLIIAFYKGRNNIPIRVLYILAIRTRLRPLELHNNRFTNLYYFYFSASRCIPQVAGQFRFLII